MELNENITQLIIRDLNHEATQAEKAALTAWINENAVHQQEYDAYVKLWEDSAAVVLKHQFDTRSAWEKIQQKVGGSQKVVPIEREARFSLKRLSAAAAILIFLSATAVYFFASNKAGSWETIAAVQHNQRITLSDGSVISLRKGSTLRYPKVFGSNERITELTGEAFFDIQPNDQAPFRVNTAGAVVEVLGTSFLVRTTDSTNQVVVTTGKVRFTSQKSGSVQVILMAGQQAELIRGRIVSDTLYSDNYRSWETGKLVFHNTPLKQTLEDIGHYYNVGVVLSPELGAPANSITIKAEFSQQTLEQVIEEIELITGLKISLKDGSLFVH